MIRFTTARMWKDERVYPHDPVYGTEKEVSALLDCGQAYEDSGVSMANTKAEIKQALEDAEIEFDEGLTKAELLELI